MEYFLYACPNLSEQLANTANVWKAGCSCCNLGACRVAGMGRSCRQLTPRLSKCRAASEVHKEPETTDAARCITGNQARKADIVDDKLKSRRRPAVLSASLSLDLNRPSNSPINPGVLTGNVGSAIRSQKGHDTCDFGKRVAVAAHRDHLAEFFLFLAACLRILAARCSCGCFRLRICRQ